MIEHTISVGFEAERPENHDDVLYAVNPAFLRGLQQILFDGPRLGHWFSDVYCSSCSTSFAINIARRE